MQIIYLTQQTNGIFFRILTEYNSRRSSQELEES